MHRSSRNFCALTRWSQRLSPRSSLPIKNDRLLAQEARAPRARSEIKTVTEKGKSEGLPSLYADCPGYLGLHKLIEDQKLKIKKNSTEEGKALLSKLLVDIKKMKTDFKSTDGYRKALDNANAVKSRIQKKKK